MEDTRRLVFSGLDGRALDWYRMVSTEELNKTD
jgi:hypothetical protein